MVIFDFCRVEKKKKSFFLCNLNAIRIGKVHESQEMRKTKELAMLVCVATCYISDDEETL